MKNTTCNSKAYNRFYRLKRCSNEFDKSNQVLTYFKNFYNNHKLGELCVGSSYTIDYDDGSALTVKKSYGGYYTIYARTRATHYSDRIFTDFHDDDM